jgi:lipid-A-disaccharide synthase
MLKAAENVARAKEGLQVVIPVAPSISKALVEKHLQHTPLRPVLIDGRAPQAVGASDVAIVASGTATLEAGLMMRPLVVVYRVSSLSYLLGRLLLKVAHVALVNLLTGRRVVPELLQGEMRPEKISREALRLWAGPEREKTLEGLRELRTRLGDTGAAARAAGVVLALLGARREKGPPSC